ncbi:MAG: non-canonical purine NTP pyrophosphatase [Planctomycetes bacterium]|nr:non-canonical purine NTP pyrophosphatase [Planctomycetota bacterium]
MPGKKYSIVVGTNNRHKFTEIRAILADVANVDLVPLSAFSNVPPIDETEKTFAGNAAKKALELARFLQAMGRLSYANQSTSQDDDDTDFEALAGERARTSGRHKKVSVGEGSGRRPAIAKPKNLDLLVMADDSGLEVDALGGAPGVLSARYAGTHGDDAANNKLLLQNLKGVPAGKRKARFVCEIALACPDGPLLGVRGAVEGMITDAPRGSGGFGYDPLFLYPPRGKTFGELDAETKNQISHRSQALAMFKLELTRLLGTA